MNVEIKLVDGLENPYAVIYTETISEEIQNIVSFLEVKKGLLRLSVRIAQLYWEKKRFI